MLATTKVITLYGDKRKKPEPATYIIEFPGGSIELSRTSEGDYWAHVAVNRGQALEDCNGFHGANGKVVGTRVDRVEGQVVDEISNHDSIQHVAVRIATE